MRFRRQPTRTPDGDLLERRERYIPHACKVPGPLDDRGQYKGNLEDGTRWRCRRCGSVWVLSNYHRFSYQWFRREDPREDEFKRTHDEKGRPLGSAPSQTSADRAASPSAQQGMATGRPTTDLTASAPDQAADVVGTPPQHPSATDSHP